MLPLEVIFTINKNSLTPNIPTGISIASSQNVDAVNYFSALSQDEQQEIIDHTHTLQSKQDTDSYVNSFNNFL